jgi:hypothetical protein
VDVGYESPAPAGRQNPIPPESCAPPGLVPFRVETHGSRRGLPSAGAPHLAPGKSTPHESPRGRPRPGGPWGADRTCILRPKSTPTRLRPGGPKDSSPRRKPWVDVGHESTAPAGRQNPLPPESCAPPGLVAFRASTHGLRRGLPSAGAPHLVPGKSTPHESPHGRLRPGGPWGADRTCILRP